jgi:hypothetical protein
VVGLTGMASSSLFGTNLVAMTVPGSSTVCPRLLGVSTSHVVGARVCAGARVPAHQ